MDPIEHALPPSWFYEEISTNALPPLKTLCQETLKIATIGYLDPQKKSSLQLIRYLSLLVLRKIPSEKNQTIKKIKQKMKNHPFSAPSFTSPLIDELVCKLFYSLETKKIENLYQPIDAKYPILEEYIKASKQGFELVLLRLAPYFQLLIPSTSSILKNHLFEGITKDLNQFPKKHQTYDQMLLKMLRSIIPLLESIDWDIKNDVSKTLHLIFQLSEKHSFFHSRLFIKAITSSKVSLPIKRKPQNQGDQSSKKSKS